MENNELCCSFTGYRPQKMPFKISTDDPAYNRFENMLIGKIIELVNEGVTTFISGMATGFDLIAAECVLEVKEMTETSSISLIAAIPFLDQAQKFNAFWKEKYEKVKNNADEVVLISSEYYPGCYMARNKYMVENSDIVLAFYDGKPGGTKNTVNYALSLQRKVVNLSEIWDI